MPATKKELCTMEENPDGCKATFPLWTRKDGFCIITIFKGSSKDAIIANDRVAAGATAYFKGHANLEIV